jgi:ribonuclease P protein component
MTAYTFRKEEKLCSQKVIGEIFLTGDSFLCYPLKVVWKDEVLTTKFPAQVVFSVPKRLFKKAHDRNLLKRQLREVYRYRKNDLYQMLETKERKIALMIVCIAKEKPVFSLLESAMTKVIAKLKKKLESQQ